MKTNIRILISVAIASFVIGGVFASSENFNKTKAEVGSVTLMAVTVSATPKPVVKVVPKKAVIKKTVIPKKPVLKHATPKPIVKSAVPKAVVKSAVPEPVIKTDVPEPIVKSDNMIKLGKEVYLRKDAKKNSCNTCHPRGESDGAIVDGKKVPNLKKTVGKMSNEKLEMHVMDQVKNRTMLDLTKQEFNALVQFVKLLGK